MKLYLPQYDDITLWCTSFLPKYEVIWTFAFVVLVSIISGLLSWQWWSSSQLLDFIKHGFVASVFVAVRSPAVHVKILPTDLVNGMWFKAFKIGGFGWSIYGKGEAHDSQGSSISLSAGSSFANEAGKMIEALQ
ncbi:BnaC08g45640D [Brassica napus]|uniref:BnaC08g45640D protein n=2 Tax=Brassica TaxID=3705 RepID=A0A078HI56_BRANA|nr:BnaC08g45640D [Brassica napus]